MNPAVATTAVAAARTGPWRIEGVDARLIVLAKTGGLSASLMAEKINSEFQLNLSRCACIARLRRIGVKMRKLLVCKKLVGPRRSPRPRLAPRKPTPVTALRREYSLPPPPTNALLGLRDDDCRYPIGRLYCGQAILKGTSFCQVHYELTHEAPRARWS